MLWTRLVSILLVSDALGISSSQIGWPVGMMLTYYPDTATDRRLLSLVGDVTPTGPEIADVEACLSIASPDQEVARQEGAVLVGCDAIDCAFAVKLHSLNAACWQHESDHCEGMLIIDRSPPLLPSVPNVKLLSSPSK
ncbi:MAG: peptide deformylase [Candidatus Hodgkinia cicadicola]